MFHQSSIICWFYHFTVVLVFTNSCINPFIYAAKYREFQEGVLHLIARIRKPREIQPQVDLHTEATDPVQQQGIAVPEI